MSFMLLRKLDDEWMHLYPLWDDENPPEFKTEAEAKEHATQLFRTTGFRCRVVSKVEVLKYEVPQRW